LAFRGEQISYAALQARVIQLARALIAVGVTRGDRVAVLLPNCPEWVVAALAIAKVGGIVSAISTFSTSRERGGGPPPPPAPPGAALSGRAGRPSSGAGGQHAWGPSKHAAAESPDRGVHGQPSRGRSIPAGGFSRVGGRGERRGAAGETAIGEPEGRVLHPLHVRGDGF